MSWADENWGKISLVSFIVSGLLGFMAIGLILHEGYGDVVKKMNNKDVSFKKGEDFYICEIDKEKNSCILHRGDSNYIFSKGEGYNSVSFKCGKGVDSNSHFVTSETKPEETKYNDICEECFAEIE